jgi:hypothetical protein
MSEQDKEWATWLQEDAKYVYLWASRYRDMGGAWFLHLATKVQETAANSALMARQAMGVE